MKLKAFLLSILLLGAATACVNELPQAGCPEGKQLSVVLSLGDAQTKADNPLINPTAAEATVRDYYVAIFDGAGKRLDYATGESPAAGENGKYTVTFQRVPDGAIQVYAIANYKNGGTNWDFTDGSWENLSAHTSKQITSIMHTADHLVKVGFAPFTVSSSTTLLDLPLTQLTAGIDIKVTSTEQPEEIRKPEGLSYSNPGDTTRVFDEKDIEAYIGKERLVATIGEHLTIVDNEGFKWVDELVNPSGSWPDNKQWNDDAENHIGNNGDGVVNAIKPEQGALYFRAKLEGNNFFSDFKIRAYKHPVNCTYKLPLKGPVVGGASVKVNKTSYIMPDAANTVSDQASFDFTGIRFYTYPVSAGMDLVMEIKIGTGICGYNLYDKEIDQYGYVIYKGRWINQSKNEYGWKEEVAPVWLDPKDSGTLFGGTAAGTDDTLPTQNPLADIKEYSLTIPAADNAKVAMGNLYQISSKYNPKVDAIISWEVVRLDEVEVDVPPFN